MTKKEVLERLRAAKTAHLQWRARAQALVAGIDVDEDKLPMLHTDCKFGTWYYGSGQDLNSLKSFRAIEEPHERLHTTYMKLFQALHGKDDRSGWRRLFGKKSAFHDHQLEEARQYLDELIGISKLLLGAIDVLEVQLKSMDDSAVMALE